MFISLTVDPIGRYISNDIILFGTCELLKKISLNISECMHSYVVTQDAVWCHYAHGEMAD